jgi:hypothetical protein
MYMRDPQIIDAELMEISGIQGDGTKFARIVAWCTTHPDEVPFALHLMMGRQIVENKRSEEIENRDTEAPQP